jgi:hypothetical protein
MLLCLVALLLGTHFSFVSFPATFPPLVSSACFLLFLFLLLLNAFSWPGSHAYLMFLPPIVSFLVYLSLTPSRAVDCSIFIYYLPHVAFFPFCCSPNSFLFFSSFLLVSFPGGTFLFAPSYCSLWCSYLRIPSVPCVVSIPNVSSLRNPLVRLPAFCSVISC